jgi:hypothetical protein
MDSRVSATGLKDIEADAVEAQDITAQDITINNELSVGTNTLIDQTGVQVYHPYNILIPLELPGYWNVHDELAEI